MSNTNGEQQRERERVVTVRLPESQHAAVVAAAHIARISMNKFCVAAIMAAVEQTAAVKEVPVLPAEATTLD